MPIEIDGQKFMLELDDIQGVEIIDLDLNAMPVQESLNVLDQLNQEEKVIEEGKMGR